MIDALTGGQAPPRTIVADVCNRGPRLDAHAPAAAEALPASQVPCARSLRLQAPPLCVLQAGRWDNPRGHLWAGSHAAGC